MYPTISTCHLTTGYRILTDTVTNHKHQQVSSNKLLRKTVLTIPYLAIPKSILQIHSKYL